MQHCNVFGQRQKHSNLTAEQSLRHVTIKRRAVGYRESMATNPTSSHFLSVSPALKVTGVLEPIPVVQR